jgi:ribosomal protein S18 acetylase RimI-like enzyme
MQDAAAIGRVHVDTWRSTYHGIVADEYLSNLSSERSQHNWETALSHSKTQSVFVAEDDQSNVVGFAACGPAREMKETFDGELYAIYVVRKVQRRGTGKELVLAVANDLKVRGLNSMLVWVLAENPFRKFYVALGGEQFASKKTVVGGKTLEELGFGWKSLDLLIERARLRRGLVNQPVD